MNFLTKLALIAEKISGRIRAKKCYLISGLKFKTVGRFLKIRGVGIVAHRNVTIGDFCWIEAVNCYKLESGEYQTFEPVIEIGKNVSLGDLVHISAVKSVSIGDDTLIGSKVYIGDHSHGTYRDVLSAINERIVPPRYRPLSDIDNVQIGKNCWIGDGAVILAGAMISENSVVGANSIVKGRFPSNVVICGTPARVIKKI